MSPAGERVRSSSAKRKVAILGGGCGGLAAAWELTQERNRDSFDVTVYQLGWRLGGKGASGRARFGTGQRIEEHGLHLWFGFYRHAFTMLAQAYREAGLGSSWWEEAFEKVPAVTLYGRRNGAVSAPHEQRQPIGTGGPPTGGHHPRFARPLAQVIRVLANGVRETLLSAERAETLAELDDDADWLDQAATHPDAIPLCDDWVPVEDSSRVWVHTPRGEAMPPAADVQAERTTRRLYGVSERLAGLRHQLEQLPDALSELPERLRSGAEFWRDTVELASAAFRGIVEERVLWNGLGVLDDHDLREWLRQYGATDATLSNAAVLRAVYDAAFAYTDGDKSKPSAAAGKAIQGVLMMANYEGAYLWRMKAGMGDVVFAPLFLALKRRGVKFQFFSRVTELELVHEAPIVERIALERQVKVRAGVEAYEPLVTVCGMGCWPSQPLWHQLESADTTLDYERDVRKWPRETLERGADFDDVVLAIPVGAQRDVCRHLTRADARYRTMLDNSHTVATKALQVWLTKTPSELANRSLPGLAPPTIGYPRPFDTYCDMSHVITVECYEPSGEPAGIAYFCSALEKHPSQAAADAAVRTAAREHLERNMRGIWPGAYTGAGFDWDVLFDPSGRGGDQRLIAQYTRANVTPSELYVQTPPGSVSGRLQPGRSGSFRTWCSLGTGPTT